MRKLSILGALLLALATAASATASTPAVSAPAASVRSAAPALAVPVTTLTWTATFTKGAVAGTATLTGLSNYSSDTVAITATGLKRGAPVSARIFYRSGEHTYLVAVATWSAHVNKSGVMVWTWHLTAHQRAQLKAAINHGHAIYFRLSKGNMIATGRLASV